MLRKLFLAIIIGLSLFSVVPVLAQDSMVPEFNTICWKRSACEKITKGADGFVPGESPCLGGTGGDEWGKCLAAGSAKTAISFGGVNTFANLGEFILKNYNFAITVAGILAVIVIIMSGFQWTMSGGNSETISTAKHRIGNAVIGLFIAYSSFFILGTINPDLVNLRMLSVYLVKPLSEVPKFCSAVQVKADGEKSVDETKITKPLFAFAADATDQVKSLSSTSSNATLNLTYEEVVGKTVRKETNCGNRYFFENSGSGTCFGARCSESGNICTNVHLNDLTNLKYSCEPASIVGSVRGSYVLGVLERGICGGYIYENTVAGNSWLSSGLNGVYKVCKSEYGNIVLEQVANGYLAAEDLAQQITYYKINSISSGNFEDTCVGMEFIGYGLVLEFNSHCTWSKSHLLDRGGGDIGFTGDITAADSSDAIAAISRLGVPNPTRSVTKADFFTKQEILDGQAVYVDVASLLQRH